MNTDQIIKRYENALDGSKRLRNVIDQLGKTDAPTPTDVRADSLFWQGKDGAKAFVTTSKDRTSYCIQGVDGYPAFVGATESESGSGKDTHKDFAKALNRWGFGEIHSSSDDDKPNRR